ncbi:MAG: stalk domain-containing protein [Bacillota bacterium]
MGRIKYLLFVLMMMLMAAVPCWGYDTPGVIVKDEGTIDCTTGGHQAVMGSPDDITVFINGDVVFFPDQLPYLNDDGRVMVPVRFVAEELGANVGWNGVTRIVSITKGDTSISLTIGRREASVNGRVIALDTEAVLKNDRTMVPVRFVSEAFGADVVWEPKTLNTGNCVRINLGGGQ